MIKDINDAQHPLRQKAIEIMEFIADYIQTEWNICDIFDCRDGNTVWYDVEDEIVNILAERRRK